MVNRVFDVYNVLETPQLILCNPNGEELKVISHALNIKLTMRYNSYSELEFVVPKEYSGKEVSYYNLIQQMRYVKVENFGIFVIGKPIEDNNGNICKKTVPCKSIDSLLAFKSVVGLKGTYPMWTIDNSDSILKFFFEYFPDWSIGNVSVELLTTYRTYDISENNWYSFLLESAEGDYDCIFTFDTFNKKINALTTKDAVSATDIYISFENLLKSANIEPVSDEIQTALDVHGADDLSIDMVNPLGTSVIYDFSYFKDIQWIHQDTIDALNIWEAKIVQYQPTYATNLTLLKTKNTELLQLQTELYELETQLKSLEEVLAAKVSGGLETSAQNALCNAKRTEIQTKNTKITIKQAEITSVKNVLWNINSQLSFANNFTSSQLNDINSITKVGTYTNDSFVKTSIMSDVDVQNEAQGLYDLAKTVLAKVSQPRYSFTSEIVNFLALPKFSRFAEQLELGCELTIGLDDDSIFNPVLLEYVIDFDDLSNANMTFCNSMRLSNQAFTIAELLKDVSSTVSSVSTQKGQWEDWVNNSKNTFNNFMDNSFDLANKAIISTSGQSFLQDQTGIRARKILSDGSISPNQLWITNNSICMTKNSWESSALALGEITFNSVKYYGLACDLLVGNIIAGQSLMIKNANNTVTIDGTGITATNASLSLVRGDGSSRIYLNPTEGIKIQSMQGGSLKDVFYVDGSGNLNFKGVLTGATGVFSGNISGSTITGSSLVTPNFSVDSLGNVTAKSINISGNSAFSGNITGSVITGNTISGGTISGTTINGGEINGSIFNSTYDINIGAKLNLKTAVGTGMYFDNGSSMVLRDYTSDPTFFFSDDISVNGGALFSGTVHATGEISSNDGLRTDKDVTAQGNVYCRTLKADNIEVGSGGFATESYVDNEISNLKNDAFGGVGYNSSTKTLKFYNVKGVQIDSVVIA